MKVTINTNNMARLKGRVASVKEISVDKCAVVTIAVDNGKDKDGNDRGDDFIDVKCFHPATYGQIKKGMLVEAYGRIKPNKYEKNGETVYSTDIVADCIEFLESRSVVEAREAGKIA